ncbi:hypothetical protein [Myroides guanonis]|uniref:OsmC-like protein n=1 Tax=Myroides guanonis TaxID=1150112 RepID=A0A1I3UR26_9FLAO|nr:hypothetical protein [Myroides guanonis]SFJ85798.1 hypothetical protein SAMN04487893_11936 [Myroides guanonis]
MKNDVVKVLGFTTRDTQFALRTATTSLTIGLLADVSKEVGTAEEYELAKLAVSIHAVGNQLGLALGLNLKSIQIEVLGELATNETEVADKQIFKKVDIVVKPSSERSIVALKQWMDELKKRSAVFIDFHQKVPTILTLVKEYEQVKVA